MQRRFPFFGLPVLVLAAASCSTAVPDAGEETLGRTEGAIINGTLDTTHEAVVSVYSQSAGQAGGCTGTIVKVDATRKIGWVVTAAHCVDLAPVLVLQGQDYRSESALRYEVIDYKADPTYSEQGYQNDFAVVRIAGVDSSTPTIPLVTSPDGLAVGTPVTSVGYGKTSPQDPVDPEDANSKRWYVNKTLSNVTTSKITYTMTTSGICQGDSGGPVLVGTGSSERVVGVHSYINGGCGGSGTQGTSGRVTSRLTGFFSGELAKAPPPDDCDLCEKVANSGTQECAAYLQKCFADKDCKGYYDCLSAGTAKATCLNKFPKAEGPFNAAVNCTCTRACNDKCSTTFQCKNTPKCGYKLPAGDCTTCTEGACCDEALDCAADGTCYLCLKTKDADEACAANAARKKLATCVATSCKDECAGSGLETGAEPATEEGGEAPPTTTTTTTEGCAVAAPGRGDRSFGAALAALLGLAAIGRRRSLRGRARSAA